MKRNIIAVLAITTTFLAACSKPEVAFDTLEQARAQARDNAQFNAETYRSNSPQFVGYKIQTNGDSTQTPGCPQGDGWASLKFIHPQNVGNVVKIKCSTVSNAIACMTEDEFVTKPYAGDEGHCQPTSKVPFPLPKLVK